MMRVSDEGATRRWHRALAGMRRAMKPVSLVLAVSFLTMAAGLASPFPATMPVKALASAPEAAPPKADPDLAQAYASLEQLATSLRMIDLPAQSGGLPRLRGGVDAAELAVDVLAAAVDLRDVTRLRGLAAPSGDALPDGRREALSDLARHQAQLLPLFDRLEQAEKAGDTASRFRVLVELARLLDVAPKNETLPFDPGTLRNQTIDPSRVRQPVIEAADFASAMGMPVDAAKAAPVLAQQPPGPDDLAETDEVRITPDIQAKADELGHDPVTIRNWVYNNIDYAPGFGSTRSAQRTMMERRGNAFDIHTLLIALLRASGIPARYAYGSVDLPVDAVRNWLGDAVTDANMAVDLLVGTGIPTTVVTSGGVTRFLRIEHVWVEAWVDFSPSRGARNRAPDTWAPMDASFKSYATIAPVPFAQHIDFDPQAAQAEMLAGSLQGNGWITGIDTVAVQGVYDRLTRQALDYVNTHPPADPSLTLGKRSIVPIDTPVLEGSLPYRIASTQVQRFAALPPGLQQRIRVEMYATPQDVALESPQLSSEVPMARLGISALQVEYVGAGENDRNLLRQYALSNAESLSASSLRVVPTLKLGNSVLAQGSSVTYGTQQYWRVSLHDPSGGYIEPFESSVFHAGSSIAFVADPSGGTTPEFAEALATAYGDTANLPVGDALTMGGIQYWLLTDLFDEQIAQARKVAIARAPSVGAFATALRVSYFFGLPRSASVNGFVTDIKAVRYAAAAPSAEEKRRAITQAGALGSLSEGLTWSLLTGRDVGGSLSASSLLLRANEAKIPIYQIDRSTIDEYLPQLALHPDDETDIRNAVNAGMTVLTPAREMTVNGWTGVGYVVQDPISGGGIWRVSGGINGGIDIGCLARAVSLNLLCQMRFMKSLKRLLALIRPGFLVGAMVLTAALQFIPVWGQVITAVMASLIIIIATIEVIMWLREVINGITSLTAEDLAALGLSDINELLCALGSPCFAADVFENLADDARYGWSPEGFWNDFKDGITFGLSSAMGGGGPGGPVVGNPVSVGNGMKWQWEVDYEGAGPYPLMFVRTYVSGIANGSVTGNKWTHTYQRSVRTAPAPLGGDGVPAGAPNAVLVSHGDGSYFQFTRRGNAYVVDGNLPESVTRIEAADGTTAGWEVVNIADETEHYDGSGRLQWIRNRAGLKHTLHYNSAGQLVSVADDFGRSLVLAYDPDSGLLASMTDPAGQVTRYSYDEETANATVVLYPDGRSRAYHYEDLAQRSHLTGLTDERGVRLATWAYDYRGRVVVSTHQNGVDKHVLRYRDNQTVVVDPVGTERTYRYTKMHERPYLVSVTQACGGCANGGTSELRYDSRGYIASRKDFNGNQTTYSHNARGLQESRVEAAGTPLARTFSTQWHSQFRRPVKLTEPLAGGSRVTQFDYDAEGNLTSVSMTAAGVTRAWAYEVNDRGQILAVDGPRTDVADIVSATFDDVTGNRLTSTDALDHATQFTGYDAHGRLTEMRDAAGSITTYAYDLRGRPTDIVEKAADTDPGEATHFDYDETGNLTRLTLPDGSWIAYTHDDSSRLTDIADNLGNRVHYTLDAQGSRIKEDTHDTTGSLASTLGRVIDELGRLKESRGARADEVYAYTYDGNGNEKTVTDPLAHVTTNVWDALDRLSRTDLLDASDADHAAIVYGYDAADNLTTVTDPRELVTRYAYTGFNELATLTSPDTGITQYRYDAAGNLTQVTDARNRRAVHAYDAANRQVQVQYGVAQGDTGLASVEDVVSFAYDEATGGDGALGRLTSADVAPGNGAPGASRLDFRYDAHGRVVRSTQQLGTGPVLAIDQNYDDGGRIDERTLPSGAVIGYGYGADGRVTTITVNGVVIVRDIDYFPFGDVRKWKQGDSVDYTRVFDQDGRVKEHRAGSVTRQIAYDAASRITAQADLGVGGTSNWSYGYDAQDRLISAGNAASAGPTAGLSLSWAYDATGNRESATSDGVVTAYATAPTSNHLLQMGSAARTYDASGNTISDGAWGYVYGARNRLVEVTQAGAALATYAYNAFGERVCKATTGQCPTSASAGSGYTQYVYDDAGHLLGEYDGAGNRIQETLWLDDTPVAVLRSASGTTAVPSTLGGMPVGDAYAFWIEPDHLDTPRVIVNQAHQIVWRWDSDPFGETPANENPSGLGTFAYNPRFPGQYFDAETGLHYNYFRDYEPETGRYVESDPIGLRAGVQTYAYASSYALGLADPFGLRGTPGPKPGVQGPHNQLIKRIADCIVLNGGAILGGGKQQRPDGSFLAEEVVSTPHGQKSSRRPDITYRFPGCQECRINVGRSTVKGEPVKRERTAMDDLAREGKPTKFAAYNRGGTYTDSIVEYFCKRCR